MVTSSKITPTSGLFCLFDYWNFPGLHFIFPGSAWGCNIFNPSQIKTIPLVSPFRDNLTNLSMIFKQTYLWHFHFNGIFILMTALGNFIPEVIFLFFRDFIAFNWRKMKMWIPVITKPRTNGLDQHYPV